MTVLRWQNSSSAARVGDPSVARNAVVTRQPVRRDVRIPLERAALLALGRAGGAVTRRQAAFVEGWVPEGE